MFSPCLDQDLCLPPASEPVEAQAFVPELVIEALVGGILPWFAWVDRRELNHNKRGFNMTWLMYRVKETHDGKSKVSPQSKAYVTRDELLQKLESKREDYWPTEEGVWYGILETATLLSKDELDDPSLQNRLERYDP